MAAAVTDTEQDPLILLRQSIASNHPPISASTADPTSAADAESDLSIATHLQFNLNNAHHTFILAAPTRFESSGKPVDLRSIYFAWLNKDVAIPEYISSTRKLNEKLVADGGAGGTVQNLVFAEKLDLITWLEGASDESEHITPLASDTAAAAGAANVAAGASGGISAVHSVGGIGVGIQGKTIDPRLQDIYNGERRTGDRNTVLRGIKPTDFSHIRKHTELFVGRNRGKQGRPGTVAPAPSTGINSSLVQNRTKPGRRPEPIILLSPSASSLLRMGNIKSFLDGGVYTAADSASGANILHISRLLPTIDAQRPLRFILVDTPDQFKPDYWSRVVAVFTTGQTWQFKSYKWQSPPDLFSHALGIYVGWRGEEAPSTVKGWGRGVMSTFVDKWNPQQASNSRWRDREVVEGIWTAIEESMRGKGWGKDGAFGGR